MCGIAGVVNLDGSPVDREVVERMTAAIAHRGPDGTGTHVDGDVGLGNRRLAIIDLSPHGAMPMPADDGAFVITYNGELYNFLELRHELEQLGHSFRSRTDTEVVLRSYVEWGERCVERFNGMFAFAIHDRRRGELFLARDRYGIKPLYVTDVGKTFLFASEIKCFLAHPGFRAKPSLPHLLEYFTFQNIFSDGTLFVGVRLVPPGRTLTISTRDGSRRERTYWDFDFTEHDDGSSDEEYAEELDRLFRQAVERQLVADVPLGAYLSGGMDSGSITALAAQYLPYLSTFTGGFDLTTATGLELGFDERLKAERMSYRFKTEHYETVLKAGDMERCLPALVWHLEDPRVGQSYPNYYISRLASKFVKVVLSGAGGDELFAGYPWRYYRAVVNDDFDHYVEKYYAFWHRLLPNGVLREFFRPDVWRQVEDVRTIDIFRDAMPDRHPPESPEEYVNHSLYLEAKTFLHGLLLVDDKLSMAHGLETRVPFLDNDLVDFAQRLPVRLKLRDLEHVVRLNENLPAPKTDRYFDQTRDGKLILRKVLSSYVSDDVADQIKQGFSGPDASWFRGESIRYVNEVIGDDDSLIYEFLDPRTVRGLVDDHLAGRDNRRLLLWSLLNFEQWCRTFLVDGRPAEPAAALPAAAPDVGGLTVLRTLRRFVSAVVGYATLAALVVVAHVERRRPPRDVPRVLWYVDPEAETLRAHGGALATLDYPVARLAPDGSIDAGDPFPEPPARPYARFLWALRNCDIVVLSPDRSLLRETPLAYHELQLLRKARRKVVVLPHGPEVRLPSRARDLLFKHALSTEQPAYARAEGARLRDLEYVLGNADVIVSGSDWVDSMPWWDRLSALPYAVDVDAWKPDASERLAGAPVVLHVLGGEPRGTEFLVRACDGVPVDLRIVDAPNEDERRRLIAEADVIAEQFVSGWYGTLAVEAMSMQKPVLSYLRDDLRELYVLFSFAEDCPVVSAAPEEVEAELRALATDPARRAELGKRGRDYVREHHSVEAAAATLDEMFKTLWEAPA